MRIKQIRDPSLVPVDQLPESYHAKVNAVLLSITVTIVDKSPWVTYVM